MLELVKIPSNRKPHVPVYSKWIHNFARDSFRALPEFCVTQLGAKKKVNHLDKIQYNSPMVRLMIKQDCSLCTKT